VLTDRTPQPVEPGPGRAGVDPLTDLPNRAEIEERLASLLARATDDQRLGVVVLDLDRFRLINRGLGARAGDLVLREIAGRLRRTVGVADHVARVAGDEFVVLLADLPTPESGCALSRRILDELRAPTMVGDMEVSVDACIGLSLFPRDGRDAESLLRCADLAVRWAKEFSHDPIQSFDEKMRRATADRLKLEQHLRGALDRDEIDLVYQPQVGIGDGVLMGVEVLVRWNRGPLGVVPPTTFVPIAEETGLIVKIGRWALERACLQAVAWDLADLPPLRLSVNVSPRQFLDPEFAQIVGEALRRSGLAAGRLALEVTESAIMKNAEQAVAIMRTLKALGVEIALDDFGVGYSSLSYLKHFPIDRVKIDRSFVQDLATDQDDRTICSGIVAMAHSRGRLVTAEGVETPAQLAFLRAQGCDEVQGYLVSRPIDPDALATLARSAGGWIDA
jgi:diguanylate cyclase (GGDEF)-like protein